MHHQQRIREYNWTHCTRVVDRSKIMLKYTPKPKPWACSHGCTINRESRDSTRPIVRVWLIVPRSCWGTHQSHSRHHAAMDAPSTENQGIQPDPLYVCGWLFQDRVEVHTKAKQAFQHAAMDALSTENQGIQPDPLYVCGWSFQDRVEIHSKTKQAVSMLPWMHHQQRIKEYNLTHCTRVVDRSKIVLRYTPKPNMPSASCHGCTRCLEKRQRNLSETANCELKCVTLC